MFDSLKELFNPSENPDISKAFEYHNTHLPTLWLLGKTGAGKSSLIQAITGDSDVEIGNGFEPCTKTSQAYSYPKTTPLLRFLDTRGLSEADYDPSEDIEVCSQQSHALLVIVKAEEPEQSDLIDALKKIKKQKSIKQILIVHTAVKQLIANEQSKAVQFNQLQFEKVWGDKIPYLEVDFELANGDTFAIPALKDKLAELLPIIRQLSDQQQHVSTENANFQKLKKEVLWYAGSAGAADAIPAVGLVAVPGIQAKMLHSLANQYAVDWNKQAVAEFIGTLGSGFAFQYASKLGIRQLVKLIPAYGQTIGSASAAVISFSSTYAIGRVACKYMYHKSKGEMVSDKEIQKLYKNALADIKEVAKNETS
ncbi:YcjF family protein [Psychromonas sp.]|uniref:YcjF family protein n=1 Tax=Psychromonas sp. TaxID=1884585 RepID=UPI0035688839